MAKAASAASSRKRMQMQDSIASDEAEADKAHYTSAKEQQPFEPGNMKLPHPHERLMTDCLDRMFLSSAGIKWISRFCVLTKDKLTFAKLHHGDKASQLVQQADHETLSKENLWELFQRHDADGNG